MNPTELTITITKDLQTGSVSVSGAIGDTTVAYGMLENARDAIYDHHKQQENRVQPAPAGFNLPKLD